MELDFYWNRVADLDVRGVCVVFGHCSAFLPCWVMDS